MNVRIRLGNFLIRLGRFVQSLAVVVMRPSDLLEFNRRTYSSAPSVIGWAEDALVDAGLSADERALLDRVPFRAGRLLVLGVGGGREAVPLAKMGFEVTGLDFVAGLAEAARENAKKRGVALEVLVQDFTRLDVPRESFDLVWLGAGAYSSVPTRGLRLLMLGRIRQALRPGGYFLCQFLISPESRPSPAGELIRRAVARLTFGNVRYQPGDRLSGTIEFAHGFRTADEARSEFVSAGFDVVELLFPGGAARGGAVLLKVR